jgi:pyridoxal phosphate enzyme (YggS family)
LAKRTPLGEKLDDVRQRIASAAAKAKRQESEVTLIAVTKTAAPEQIREILSLGVGDLGESRVQILAQRAAQLTEYFNRRAAMGEGAGDLPKKLRWHMIGHLQRNKVKAILPVIASIHSIDSLRLAEEIDTQAAKIDKRIPVLMEVNASEETSKFGVAVGAAVHLGEQIDSMPNLQLIGLMTMAPLEAKPAAIQHVFSRTHEIFEEMKWHKIGGAGFRHLSMGMSHDFELAIAEGATMIRVGTALFGGKTSEGDEPME